MATFGEILRRFKDSEEPENIVPLIEDASLRNGLVAWKSVTISVKGGLKECPHDNETSQWNWLWQQVEYDPQTFGTVAGVKPADVGKLVTRLIGLRLIYPDGTVNELAKNYLQTIIMAKLPKKRGRLPSEEPQK